jgi:hypothetical protein
MFRLLVCGWYYDCEHLFLIALHFLCSARTSKEINNYQ